MSMNCRDFERLWMVRSPGELPPAMRAHLSSCPVCAALAQRDAAADTALHRFAAAQPIPDVDRARIAIRRALEERSVDASPRSWRRPMLLALTGLASAAALAALRLERPAKHEVVNLPNGGLRIVAPVDSRDAGNRRNGQKDAQRLDYPAVNDGPAPTERPMNGSGQTKPASGTQAHLWVLPGDRVPAKRVVVVYGPETHGPGAHGPSLFSAIRGSESTTTTIHPHLERGPRSPSPLPPRSLPRSTPGEPSSADLLALNEGAPANAQPFAPEPAPGIQPLALPPVQARKPGSALVDDLLYLNPVRIASADDSGLSSAVQAIAAEEPATDPRLQQKVYVHSTMQRLVDLLSWLTKATGVSLVARLEVADERLNLWAEERPLMDIMRDIRHLRGYYWSRSKRGDRYVYSLWQDAQSRAREEAETQRLALEEQRKFAENVEKHVKALHASEAELKRLAQDDPYLVAQMLHPVVRGGYQLLAALAPDQQAQLLQGQTPSRGLSFGEMVKTFALDSKPGDKWFDSPEYRAGMAPLGDVVTLKMSDMTPDQRAAVGAIVKGAIQTNKREYQEIRRQDPSDTHLSGYLEWHANALAAADLQTATASLFRWGDPDSEGLSLRVDVQSGGRGWGIYSNIGESPFWQKTTNDMIRQGKLQQSAEVQEVVAKYLDPKAKREEAPIDETALKPGESPDPILDAPISVTWKLALRERFPEQCYCLNEAEVLAALCHDLARPLAVDPMPIGLEQPRTGPAEFRWEKRPLRGLLHHLFPRWECHTDGGTIFISGPEHPHHAFNELPPAVEQFLKARSGPFTLEDMALLARSLSPWQISKLHQYLPSAAMDQMLAAQDLLRLYGELAPVQRAALAQGLPYAAMTPAQRSLFLAFAQRQRPFVEPWRFQTGALQVTQQPAPARKRWDNAFPVSGTAELTVRFLEDDTARFPLDLVGKPEHAYWIQPVADLVGQPFPGFAEITRHPIGARAAEKIREPTLTDARLRKKPAVILITRPFVEPYVGMGPAPATADWVRALAERLQDTGITVAHDVLGPREAATAPAAPAPPPNLLSFRDEGDINAQPFDTGETDGAHIDQSPTLFVVSGDEIVKAVFEGNEVWDMATIERDARRLLTPGLAATTSLP
jgi:hypothetical protein